MNRNFSMALAALAILTLAGCSKSAPDTAPSASASPQQAQAEKDPGASGDKAERRRERYKKNFEEMDTNHDGKLSDAEKSAGLDKMLEKNEKLKARVDTNHDGTISPEEKAAFLPHFMKPPKER